MEATEIMTPFKNDNDNTDEKQTNKDQEENENTNTVAESEKRSPPEAPKTAFMCFSLHKENLMKENLEESPTVRYQYSL